LAKVATVQLPRARTLTEDVSAAAATPAPSAGSEHHRPTPDARRRSAKPTWPVTLTVLIAAMLASGIVVYRSPHISTASLVFPLLALFAEMLREDVYGTSTISLSAVPVLGAVAAGRPIAAIIAAACCGIASTYSGGMRRRVEPYLFNTATFMFSAS